MEVKPGYKQTELGVIPKDWQVRRIDSVCKLINGRGFKPFEWKKTGLPIIRIQNLNGSPEFNCYAGSYDPKLEVEPGQLLFAWSGSRGTSFGPHIWKGPFGLLNYHTWKVAICESEICKEFFFHQLRQLTAVAEGWAHGASALVHVQKWQMEGLQLALPTTKGEQNAIAEALSDADALIESLEHLIVKKRHLKQGAMQELLTGKKRLPGFGDEWEVRALGTVIGALIAGVSVNSVDEDSSEYPHDECILKTSAVSNGRFLAHECKKIDPQDLSRVKLSPKRNTIIISRMNTPDLVGECGYVEEDHPLLFLPDRLWMTHLVPKADINSRWLGYLLSSEEYKARIKTAATGTSGSMKNLSKEALLSLPVRFPTLAEQTATANVLSDMDADIVTLEAKLSKARQLKQGMMQELLTGKVRLV